MVMGAEPHWSITCGHRFLTLPKVFSGNGDQNFGVSDQIEQRNGSLASSKCSGVDAEDRFVKSSKTEVLFDSQFSPLSPKLDKNGF